MQKKNKNEHLVETELIFLSLARAPALRLKAKVYYLSHPFPTIPKCLVATSREQMPTPPNETRHRSASSCVPFAQNKCFVIRTCTKKKSQMTVAEFGIF